MSYLKIRNYIIDKPLIDILHDVQQELHNGKLRRVEVKGDNISVTCPSHSDGLEKRNSCGIYIGDDEETGYGHFHCFTCSSGGPFYHFIAECFDIDDEKAQDWLIDKYGTTIAEQEIVLPHIDLTRKEIKYLDPEILDKFEEYHPYLAERKISQETAKKFQIKYDKATKCIVFPVYDEHNKLYMLTRRSTYGKKFIIDAQKEKPIYLLNYIKQNNISEATIVESQLNCLTCWEYGIPSVATFGCGVTNHQIELLNRSGLRTINICFDGDAAGRKGTKRLIENLRKDIFVNVIVVPEGEDVNSMDKEKFLQIKKISKQDWLKDCIKKWRN